MAKRIAVLFDADNVNCHTASATLDRLADRGNVVVARAVGDFSTASLANWIGCARERGIDLVMQPGLGKGKKATDIRLTIEAMDITHAGRVDTVALVSHDADFTPLALRLRNAGISVLGFSHVEPSAAFKAACSGFEVLGQDVPKATLATEVKLAKADQAQLKKIIEAALAAGPLKGTKLRAAIRAEDADLVARLQGKGKFVKVLVQHGLVHRVDDDLVTAVPRSS